MVTSEPATALVAGFPVAVLDQAAFLDLCRSWIDQNAARWIVTLNLEMVSRCRLDKSYRQLLAGADLFIADGMPLVWGSKLKRGVLRVPERLTGSDLADQLLRMVPSSKIAVIGGKEPLAGLRKAGIEDPEKAFIFSERVAASEAEAQRFADELNARGSQLVFIALGVPKQDRLAALLRPLLKQGLLIGVGGTFEIMAGDVKKAPQWMKKSGLEWLFRLSQEPRRLARRYLVVYWVGGFALAGDILKSWLPGKRKGPV